MANIGSRFYSPDPYECDVNGVPLAGGQLFFYLTGTTAKLATYADVSLTVPNTNPVIADANGRFGTIFLSQSNAYAVELRTAPTVLNPMGVQIYFEDPCGPAAGGAVGAVVGIIGEIRAYAGIAASIPANWMLCYGQAISRITYAALFTALGTTWGAGDGSATFNLPDFRGRALFGLDNMGGTAASRITSGVSGISGATLGATGGSQYAQKDTCTASTSVVSTDSGHVHPYTTMSSGNRLGVTPPAGVDDNLQVMSTGTGYANITSTATTTVTSALTGTSQNMPPAGIVNYMIYVGPAANEIGLTVTDGVTAVENVGTLDFTIGAVVTAGATGTADIAIASVAVGLTGTGTNQATALPLTALVNVVTSAPSGTGFILSLLGGEGTVVVQNMDNADNAPVYPPVGAQINALGTNVPFVVGSAGGRISFSTAAAGTQWYAG